MRVRRFRNFETHQFRGREIAAPVDALVQALPELTRNTAVSVLDSAVNRGVIAPVALGEIRKRLKGRQGVGEVRSWLDLVDPLAQSPFETLARLQCLDAGLPAPSLQVSVWDERKRAIAHGDLGWQREDGTWVLVDLDGRKYHEDLRSILIDRRRQNAIALTGRHTHLRFAWEDLQKGVIPRTVASALSEVTSTSS